jgi:hypothetical protein
VSALSSVLSVARVIVELEEDRGATTERRRRHAPRMSDRVLLGAQDRARCAIGENGPVPSRSYDANTNHIFESAGHAPDDCNDHTDAHFVETRQ